MSLIIILSLIIVPFLLGGGVDIIRVPKEIGSIIALVLISLTGMNYNLRPLKNKWLYMLVLWAFLNTFVFNNFSIFRELPNVIFAYKELLYIFVSVSTIFFIASYIPTNNKIKFLNIEITDTDINIELVSKIISWCVVIQCTYGLIQMIGLDQYFIVGDMSTGWKAQLPLLGRPDEIGSLTHRIVGTLGNPSILACWVAMCFPFCFKNKIALSLSIITLIATACSTAIISAFCGSVYYVWHKSQRLAVLIVILAVLIGAFIPKSYLNMTGRIEVHKEAFKLLATRPLTGLGLGNFEYLVGRSPEIVKRLNNQSWRELHDEYGQIWFSLGFGGLVLAILFAISLLRIRCDMILMASFVSFLAASLTYFPIRVAPQSFYIVIIIGLMMRFIWNSVPRAT